MPSLQFQLQTASILFGGGEYLTVLAQALQ
jgi:hypothetical protein